MDVIRAIGFEAKTTAFKTNVTIKQKCNARNNVYVQLLFLMFSFFPWSKFRHDLKQNHGTLLRGSGYLVSG